MDYSKLSAEQRVERAAIQVMRDPRFIALSGILMMGDTLIVEKGDRRSPMDTAATNGKNKYFTREFVMGLTEPQLNGLVVHEAKHIMYQHIITWEHLWRQNAMCANMAMDFVINLEIKDADPSGKFIDLPPKGCIDEKYRNMDTQQVFRLLMKEAQGKGGGGKGGSGNEDGDGSGFDFHDFEDADSMTDAEKQELARQIDQAIRQGAILAGKTGGELDRGMIEAMKTKIDWREELREFIVTTCDSKDQSTWRRPNRRWIQHDLYMPTQEGEAIGEILVGIDTSGSIDNEFLGSFLGELVGICEIAQPELVHVVYWDAAVAGHEKYPRAEQHTLIASTKPKGGGGTSPSCVTAFMKEKKIKPMAVVMATDGHVGSDWGGTWPCPVLWLVKGNNSASAANGKTIHID